MGCAYHPISVLSSAQQCASDLALALSATGDEAASAVLRVDPEVAKGVFGIVGALAEVHNFINQYKITTTVALFLKAIVLFP